MSAARIVLVSVAGFVLVLAGMIGAVVVVLKVRAGGGEFSYAPVLSVCILVPGFLVLMVLSAILYREQRRMAPLGTVLLLTGLRLMLIFLLAILFLQPMLRWQHTSTSAGTLWLVLDQSPSMQTNDPQATATERLRWAEGLGYVSRSGGLGELAARVHVMSDELDALVPDAGAGMGGDAERKAVAALGDAVTAWADEMDKLAREPGATEAHDAGGTAARGMQQAASAARNFSSHVSHSGSLREARGALNTFTIHQWLDPAEKMLQQAAAAADAQYARDHKGASDMVNAEARMASYTRGDIAQGILAGRDARGATALAELAEKYHLRIAGFADKAQTAGQVEKGELPEAIKTSMTPSGQSTNLASALQFIAEQVSTGQAASVIVVSDGRSNTGADPGAVAKNLAARGVRVFGLMVGSRELSPDAAVEPVDFPDWIYSGDAINPRALIRLDGLRGQPADVELRRDGVVLERRSMRANGDHEMIPFDFTDKPPDTDKVLAYELRVAQMPGEVNTQNNVSTFRVAVKKEKLAAIIVEDRPRWEYRYLAAYLSQRPGFKLQTVLLQPALVVGVSPGASVTASPDNPRTEAQRLPDTLADWQKFDLIILGDVGPDVVTPQMQQFIAAAVRDKGSTLITIAGQRAMPGKYGETPLAELLPVTLRPQWTEEEIVRHTRLGFRPETSPTAGVSALAQLAADPSTNSNAWQSMPSWFWHSAFTEARPAASVLWTVPAVAGGGGGDPIGTIAEANRHALMSTMTIGLGHSLYLSSDQSWRLRQVGGANLHNRFWGGVLNWAVGSDLPAGGKFVRFGANQPVYDQTQPVIITAHVLKDDLTPYTGLSFTAEARAVRGGTTSRPAADGGVIEARFSPMESPGYYQATLTGLPIGDLEISLKGSEVERLLNSDPTVTLRSVLIKVFPTMNAERQNMNTNAALLEAVCRSGAGFSVDAPYADVLLSRLPKIEHTETSIYQLGFFTDPDARGTKVAHWGFFILFLMLITLEWGLRKRAGLV